LILDAQQWSLSEFTDLLAEEYVANKDTAIVVEISSEAEVPELPAP